MKRGLKIFGIAVLALAIYSLVPVASLYLERSPSPSTNEDALQKIKNKEGELFEFIFFGDNHSGLILDDSATLKLIRHINREDRFKKVAIDFVVSSGDITFRGSAWDYLVFNKIRSHIKWPFIATEGNHDTDNNGLERLKKYIGESEFSFGTRNSYFIFLDNSETQLTEKQFEKLEKELIKSSSYKHRFIIMHKMPVSPYQQSWYRPELSPWSYRFMKMCEKHKVDMVLTGHEHMFKESDFGGVKYITSGGGGMITQIPSKDGGFLHYIVVRVYGDYVDYEIRRVFPPFWEFLTYYMWKEFFYFLKSVVY